MLLQLLHYLQAELLVSLALELSLTHLEWIYLVCQGHMMDSTKDLYASHYHAVLSYQYISCGKLSHSFYKKVPDP